MNILYSESLKHGNLGTQSTHIFGVVNSLRKLGHNVVLLNEEESGRVTALGNERRSPWGHMRDSMLQSRILKPVRGGGIILYFLLRDIWNFLQVLVILVRKRGRFDVIYRRDHLFNSEYILARLFRIPVVKEVNGITGDDLVISGWVGKVARRIIDRIDRFTLPKADEIIVVTSNLKEVLQKDYGVPAGKIVVVPNGTNTDLFKPMDAGDARKKLNLSQSSSYICFVGAFHVWAGIENIVKSVPYVLKECPDTRFLLVGDGALKQEMVDLGGQLGISDKMIFTGIVPYEDVPLYINASDIGVCPGADNFRNKRVGGGSPLKLPEYMACARPIIVGSVVELSKDVTASGSGLVVDMGNPDELAKAFISLLQDEELRKKMGERGRQAALEKYSWLKVAERIAEICRKLDRDENNNRVQSG
jgi:glycosyltransferase involved in cell wall biosynthesis